MSDGKPRFAWGLNYPGKRALALARVPHHCDSRSIGAKGNLQKQDVTPHVQKPILVVTADTIIATARANQGRDLPTIGGRTTFQVTVEGGVPVFHPTSTHLPRAATNRARLEQVAEIYNRTGSLKIPDYKSTGSRNLSYILSLVQIASSS